MSESHDSNFKPFLQQTSNVFGQNRLLKIMMGMMVIGVWMIYSSVQDFKTHQQTIVIPGGQRAPYEIRNYSASEQYIFDMANYITYLAGNFSPNNVSDRFNILLGLFHESSYPRYQSHFKELAHEIQQFKNISHIAELAYPDPLFSRENQLRIRMKKSKVVGTTIKPAVVNYLIVDYQIIDGRFWIMNLQELTQSEYSEVQRNEK
jgi:conjugal transfer pilus assembly protein TraE